MLISYFSQIRNIGPNIIPVSTALWDPKWFQGIHTDARGVLLGFNYKLLSPHSISNVECSKDCPHKSEVPNCSFLRSYKEYLNSLDFDQVYSDLLEIESKSGCKVCLMVYEAPWNPCSERQPLIDWFNEHNVELTEFNPNG